MASEKRRADDTLIWKHTTPPQPLYNQTLLITLGNKSLVMQANFYPQYIFKLHALKQTLIFFEQLQESL